MKFKDYYKILGVSEAATQDEIKKAYRKKARQYHPDVSRESDAEAKFKEVNEAHEALRDPDRRAEYDQLKRQGYSQGDEFRRPGDWRTTGGFESGQFAGGQFGDFFESLFGASMGGAGGFGAAGNPAGGYGHAAGRRQPRQGDEVRLKMMVSLENAYKGGKANLKIPAGAGQPSRLLNVKIPAGVVHGQQLRLRSQGRPGVHGGAAGDLILTINLKEHALFEIDGADITIEVPVTPFEAVSGLKLSIPTLGGQVTMAIPAGVQSGTRLRLRGRGLPASTPGDQFVVVQIQAPVNPSDKIIKLLKAVDEENESDPRHHFTSYSAASSESPDPV
ncbi:hypothetical protein AB833_03860 [Chromatiales bacterium (ex Bugula neritina AB1)]|nr:hypothetical protein AB833_03860 [Chromatiales bacterium (ex Bugula neritina AB1)]